jgi:hypothetical protein
MDTQTINGATTVHINYDAGEDDGPLTASEEAAIIKLCDERRNQPTLPLWMVLSLPHWLVSLCFWVKGKLGMK